MPPRIRRFLAACTVVFTLIALTTARADITATFNSASDVGAAAASYSASGPATLSLGYAPVTGTELTVVQNTGLGFIAGTFSNLAQGQTVALSYGGLAYEFVANYYGGTGNDLVLVWKRNRPLAWGGNGNGQLGDKSTTNRSAPTAVVASGVLSGKTVLAGSSGGIHSMVLCSDGTVAAWGLNTNGQLGDNSTIQSLVPVAVTTSGALAGKTVVAVAAGLRHSMALCSDGTVATWGLNANGQLGNGSTTDSNVPVAVSTSGVLAGKTVVAISAGANHNLALCSDGTVVAWGEGYSGQLGNNSSTQSNVPVAVVTSGVLSGKTVMAVAAGWYHSLVLCSDGTLAAWGMNNYGQLGDNSTSSRYVPITVNTGGVLFGKTVVGAAAGEFHSLALCSDGTVASWGLNNNGQLGNGTTMQSSVPVAVNTVSGTSALFGKSVMAVAAGGTHSLALCSDATMAAWGLNSYGQLGGNHNLSQSSVPLAVVTSTLAAGERFISLCSNKSYYHSLAIVAVPPGAPAVTVPTSATETTTTATLGGNVTDSGGLALIERGVVISKTSLNSNPVIGGANVTTVPEGSTATGVFSTTVGDLTLHTDYTFKAYATNALGTTYTSAATFTTQMVSVTATYTSASVVPATSITASIVEGSTATLALGYAPAVGTELTVVKNTGLRFISGAYSNLAHGQTVTLSFGGVNYDFVANYYGGTGNDLVLVWKRNRPLAWGWNYYGQLGDGSTTNRAVPAAVLTSGVLSGKTVISITGGAQHSLALCSDGTVAAWGNNSSGQLGNGSTTDSPVPVDVSTSGVLSGKTVVAIAVGVSHSMALCSDGSVAAWGQGYYGQLGNNSTSQSNVPVAVSTTGVLSGKKVVAIAGGFQHSLALCSDGTVASWGGNSNGMLGNDSLLSSSVPVAVTTSGVLSGKTVVAIAAGYYHNVVLCSDGTLAAWGDGTTGGRLGNNSATLSTVPVAVFTSGVLAGRTVVSIATGSNHTLALCSDNTLVAWGSNQFGELGNNSTAQTLVPVYVYVPGNGVLAGKTFVSVAGGDGHSVLLCSDGTVATWGYNGSGQLGNNSTTQSNVPVLLNTSTLGAGERFTKAVAFQRSSHTMALAAGQITAPVVTTPVSASLTSSSATIGGTLASDGYSPLTERGMVYARTSLNSNPHIGGANVTTVPVAGLSQGAFTTALSGLIQGTSYTFKAYATNALGTTYTSAATFTTLANPPVVTTPTSTGVTATAATLGGTVDSDGGGTITVRGVVFSRTSLNSDPLIGGANVTTATASGTTGVYTTAVSGLSPGISYTYKAYATNVAGTTYSSVATFTTPSVAPTVTTPTSTSVTTTTSTLGGNVTSDGGAAITGRGVVFSQTSLNANPEIGGANVFTLPEGGGTTGVFTTAVSGLSSETSYTFKAYATNMVGTSYTNAATFTTRIGSVTATYNSVTDVRVTLPAVTISSGSTMALTLGYAPMTGTELTVVKNTGMGFITGTFSNLAQGQTVALGYGGVTYEFVANYYGGTGNDLVLVWKNSRPLAWGNNANGQLGDNSTTQRNVPTPVLASGVLSGKTVVNVSAGASHSVVLCSDGTVATWGLNTNGQLGNNSTSQSNVPVAVNTASGTSALFGKTVVAIAVGSSHSLARCSDGTVAAWGLNTNGRLGNNGTTQSLVPVAVYTSGALFGKTVVAAAAGASHNIVLCSDGTVATWGLNTNGQLGNGGTTQTLVPVAITNNGVLSGKTVVAITAGTSHSMALCSDGTVATWGLNTNGQLGNNSTSQSLVPVAVNTGGVLSGKTVTAVAAGMSHSLVLCSDGTVATWGLNTNGQLGNNSTSQSNVPVAVNTVSGTSALFGKTVLSVAAGTSHSMALCSDGSVTAWGLNASGQLGNNSTTQSNVPVALNTTALALGERFTMAINGQSALHNLALLAMPPPTAPIVTTPTSASVTTTSATLGGNVTGDGGTTITARGVVFSQTSLNSDPQIGGANVTTAAASGTTGVFTTAVSGLSAQTGYTFKAYATNSLGTTYTSTATFTTLNTAPTAPAGTTTGTTGDQQTVTIDFPATDADGDAVSISNAVSGTGVTVNSFTGTSVTFTPDASFTGSGSFTYTVSDGFDTATGTVTVTVTDNDAPIVTVPANITVPATSPSGAVATFSVSATDAVNGAVSATPTPASGSTFAIGTTAVNVTAQDAASNVGSASFTVTVNPLTPADSWRYNHFGSTSNTGNAADVADWDSDGITNLMEFAFGTLPNDSASGPPVIEVTGGVITRLGTATVRTLSTSNSFSYAAMFGRRKDRAAAGLTYTVQFSGDMMQWFNSSATPTVIADDGTMEAVTVRYPFFVGGKKAKYFRVMVSNTP